MTIEQLRQAGAQCRHVVYDWISAENGNNHPGDKRYIYDLSNKKEVRCLTRMGFDIRVIPVGHYEAEAIEGVYSNASPRQQARMNAALVGGTLNTNSIDYRVLSRGKVGPSAVKSFFPGQKWQAGICTVGSIDRSRGIRTLNNHPRGPEVLAAIGIPGVYFLTPSYDEGSRSFPVDNGIACYLPSISESGLVVAVATKHGHWAPEMGVNFVGLPDGTGGPLSAEEKAANRKGVVFIAHNVRLGSKDEAAGTPLTVTGHTPLEGVLNTLQIYLEEARPNIKIIMGGK